MEQILRKSFEYQYLWSDVQFQNLARFVKRVETLERMEKTRSSNDRKSRRLIYSGVEVYGIANLQRIEPTHERIHFVGRIIFAVEINHGPRGHS